MGSRGGRDEDDSGDKVVGVVRLSLGESLVGVVGSSVDAERACGSLRSRMTWVIVGWKMPPYLEWAMRCMGRVLP
jgi:hypothetical protein